MAKLNKPIIGQIVAHELQEKTEQGAYPVKVKIRIPVTIGGELFKARFETYVEQADLSNWPLGKGVNIAANLSQIEIDFEADPDADGEGETDGEPARRRGRRSAAAPH